VNAMASGKNLLAVIRNLVLQLLAYFLSYAARQVTDGNNVLNEEFHMNYGRSIIINVLF
jgi:hypothetical protein